MYEGGKLTGLRESDEKSNVEAAMVMAGESTAEDDGDDDTQICRLSSNRLRTGRPFHSMTSSPVFWLGSKRPNLWTGTRTPCW